MTRRIDAQVIEDYASIILRQETGMDVFGNPVERYQESDREFINWVEDNVNLDEFSLNDAVTTKMELQKERIG